MLPQCNKPACTAPNDCQGLACAVKIAAVEHNLFRYTRYVRVVLQVNAAQQHLQQSLPDDDAELSEEQEAALVRSRV